MSPKESKIIKVDSDAQQVVCDGGGGPLGHPQVWYTFDGKPAVACHYCGRVFSKDE